MQIQTVWYALERTSFSVISILIHFLCLLCTRAMGTADWSADHRFLCSTQKLHSGTSNDAVTITEIFQFWIKKLHITFVHIFSTHIYERNVIVYCQLTLVQKNSLTCTMLRFPRQNNESKFSFPYRVVYEPNNYRLCLLGSLWDILDLSVLCCLTQSHILLKQTFPYIGISVLCCGIVSSNVFWILVNLIHTFS